jgi:hypothetical protein
MEEPVDAFVRHFCGGADAEVRVYARGALAAAGEEGEAGAAAAAELADSLLPFLPPGADVRGFAAAVEQLLGLLAGGAAAGGAPAFEWLAPAAPEAEAPKPAASPAAEPTAADEPAADEPAAVHPPPPAALGLSATAAEFAPPPPPAECDEDADAELARQLAAADLGPQYWEEEEAADGWEYGGYGASTGYGAPPGYGAASRGGGRAAAVRALLPALTAAPEREALRLLGGHFPEYSAAALADVHAQCGGNFPATAAALCALEAELEGAALGAAERAAREAAAAAAAAARRPAAFTADDFPSLGGGGGGARPPPAAPAGGDYARRARAAAARPAPPPAPRPRAAAAFASSSAAGARPAWEAGAEGVRRVSTGAAVAAEYADARAAAADHARLRNQLFQQATLAYQSGNRALAKELGARGRAENEAMHAAHAAAAGDTFARRNAAAGGGGGGEVVDLHGLHVGEALAALERSLAAARAARAPGLRVVVGVGAHARPGAARLPDAARAWLAARGLEHRERFAGMLDVVLRY